MIHFKLRLPLLVAAALCVTQLHARDFYITDQFEVTLRSGTSTANSILSMLKSGQKVEVLEEDVVTQYSLVKTADGKQGYVLTRFLDEQPSGRERAAGLTQRNNSLRQTIAELKQQLDDFRSTKQGDDQQITTLSDDLNRTRKEYQELRESTRDTVRVLEQNRTLQARINILEQEKQQLTEENAVFKDRTAMDWFVRGAGVFLAAFLIGILVTRIRWKKRDSWGSY